MKTHIKIVAALHIALGILSLLGAVALFAILGLVGGIASFQGEHQAAGILAIIAIALGGFLLILALPGIVGGAALLAGWSWGRPVVLVLGVLDLINIPFGTVLGIYTLWALLHEPESQLSGSSEARPMA
jgi:hypothetical protein